MPTSARSPCVLLPISLIVKMFDSVFETILLFFSVSFENLAMNSSYGVILFSEFGVDVFVEEGHDAGFGLFDVVAGEVDFFAVFADEGRGGGEFV